MDQMKFKGAVAVVTGAGSGIGRSISHALAQAGSDVVIADIELDAAQAVCGEIEAMGQRALAVQVDVAKQSAVHSLAEQAYQKFGKVSVLVNNAGVALRPFVSVWVSWPSSL